MRNKRFLLKFIVFVMTMMYIFSAPMSENVFAITTIAGDVDENGKIDLKDATIALKLAVGITTGVSVSEQGKLNADYDASGKIDLKDATQILRKAVGISDKWVLNTSTHKIHYPNCSDVKQIKPDNYSTSSSSVDELLAEGYTTCGHCFK